MIMVTCQRLYLDIVDQQAVILVIAEDGEVVVTLVRTAVVRTTNVGVKVHHFIDIQGADKNLTDPPIVLEVLVVMKASINVINTGEDNTLVDAGIDHLPLVLCVRTKVEVSSSELTAHIVNLSFIFYVLTFPSHFFIF